jgi:preprotein translocase subunit SecF
MEFFKPNMNVNFLGMRFWCAAFSLILCVLSVISLSTYGLNLGLEFTGGTQLELSFPTPVDLNSVRQRLNDAGYKNIEVQSYGGVKNVLITLASSKKTSSEEEAKLSMQQELTSDVMAVFKEAKLNEANYIGAVVSSQLASQGLLAVLLAMIATMIYIAFRFEWRLAIGAAVALVHDPVLILGVFSFFHVQFSLVALSAVLTVIGYSLHDTIVVFDRVRENFRRIRRGTSIEIMNTSINQTMARTVISSALTLVVCVVLLFFGGPSIHPFALALVIGILIGTYSSIYVAGSLAVSLGLNRTDLMTNVKKDYDEMP